MADLNPNSVEVEIIGFSNCGATIKYIPESDEMEISVWFAETPGEFKTLRISGFQQLANKFEEGILNHECYEHSEGALTIRAEEPPTFWIYLHDQIWGKVRRGAFLQFIRRNAWMREVVTNVPRPPDPVLKTLQHPDIRVVDGNLVLDVVGHGNPHDFRTYPFNLEEFSLAHQMGWFPFDLGSGLNLYLSEMPLHDQRFSLHLFGAEHSIQISLGAMKAFVDQINRVLVWEQMHTDN